MLRKQMLYTIQISPFRLYNIDNCVISLKVVHFGHSLNDLAFRAMRSRASIQVIISVALIRLLTSELQ